MFIMHISQLYHANHTKTISESLHLSRLNTPPPPPLPSPILKNPSTGADDTGEDRYLPAILPKCGI